MPGCSAAEAEGKVNESYRFIGLIFSIQSIMEKETLRGNKDIFPSDLGFSTEEFLFPINFALEVLSSHSLTVVLFKPAHCMQPESFLLPCYFSSISGL